MNFIPILVAGLVPMIIGAIYYGPLFGNVWMQSAGLTKEDVESGNMPVIMGLSLLLAMVLSFGLNMLVELTHGSFTTGEFVAGSTHTFGHGAFHGVMFSLFIIAPALIIMSLFHRMSAKNIFINVAYWVITCAIMAGITDVWN